MKCPAQVNVDGTLYGCDVQHDQPPPRVHVSGPGHASWGEGYAIPAAPVVHPEPGDGYTYVSTECDDHNDAGCPRPDECACHCHEDRSAKWRAGLDEAVIPVRLRKAMALADREVAAAVAAVRADTEAERDLIHADLTDLVNALGMGDHARPYSSHQLMQEAIANVRVLAGQVAAIRALPDRQACTCRDDTPVGIGHHAARRGYNEALTDVRAALVASSPTTPEAKK